MQNAIPLDLLVLCVVPVDRGYKFPIPGHTQAVPGD